MAAEDSKSARTRRRILDAAASLFSQHGYASARLTDIAERAGLQAGSLYYHFESREALVAEILHLGLDEVSVQVRAAVAALSTDASALERLAAAIRAHSLAVLRSTFGTAEARISNQVPPEIAAAYRAEQRAYAAFWHELLADAQASGEIGPDVDLVTVRMLAFGAMNWTPEWFKPSRGRSATAVADSAVQMVLNGIARVR